MQKILCIGSVTADVMVSEFERLPLPGELVQFKQLAVEIGGCAANAASGLAKLGGEASLCCKIGEDLFGAMVEQRLCQLLPSTKETLIKSPDVNTTLSVVLINSSGERGFLYHPGSTSQLTAAEIPQEQVDKSDIVFVSGAMLLTKFDGQDCAEFLAGCKNRGKYTVMDTAWDFEDQWLPKILPSLPYLDLFMPSYDEAARLSGERDPYAMANAFKRWGAGNVIIKLGAEGALVSPEKGEEEIIPVFAGMPVVDTTGAGDSFCAGFLYGLSNGWDFTKSAVFGNAVAAHCITKIGATTGIPNAQAILNFIQERGSVEWTRS